MQFLQTVVIVVMSRIESFPPLSAPGAHTLILGSMPGVASLQAQQYYAHPRNLFWPLVCAALGIDASLPYTERVRQVAEQGFAVWDVLAACRREGSLDTRIVAESIEVNDFANFFAAHPLIGRVFFNGTTAERFFYRYAAPRLDAETLSRLQCRRLPSTSPANASIKLADKTAAWKEIVR